MVQQPSLVCAACFSLSLSRRRRCDVGPAAQQSRHPRLSDALSSLDVGREDCRGCAERSQNGEGSSAEQSVDEAEPQQRQTGTQPAGSQHSEEQPQETKQSRHGFGPVFPLSASPAYQRRHCPAAAAPLSARPTAASPPSAADGPRAAADVCRGVLLWQSVLDVGGGHRGARERRRLAASDWTQRAQLQQRHTAVPPRLPANSSGRTSAPLCGDGTTGGSSGSRHGGRSCTGLTAAILGGRRRGGGG